MLRATYFQDISYTVTSLQYLLFLFTHGFAQVKAPIEAISPSLFLISNGNVHTMEPSVDVVMNKAPLATVIVKNN